MMYAVVAAVEKDAASGAELGRASKRKDPRPKSDMVAVSRFEMPRAWLQELFSNADSMLLRSELAIVTDASPRGIGAILCRVEVALEVVLKEEDAAWFGV